MKKKFGKHTNQILVAIFCSLLIFSCKKDKLSGDKALLIGEWKWISTEYISYNVWAGNDTMQLTPLSEGNNHYLTFEEKGKLKFKNDHDQWRKRIVFAKYAGSGHHPGYDYFGIFLNNDHHFLFQGVVNEDTIILYHSPHLDYEVSDTTTSTSYFIRN